MATIQTTVRLDEEYAARLEAIGKTIGPKPLNRSEMINVAVRDYVDRHGSKPKSKSEKR